MVAAVSLDDRSFSVFDLQNIVLLFTEGNGLLLIERIPTRILPGNGHLYGSARLSGTEKQPQPQRKEQANGNQYAIPQQFFVHSSPSLLFRSFSAIQYSKGVFFSQEQDAKTIASGLSFMLYCICL
jgi:hypothetical protein